MLLQDPGVVVGVIAGVSALAGVLVSQATAIFAAHLQHKRQHRALLREKYEQVALLFSASLSWFQEVQASRSLQELQTYSNAAKAREMYSLCIVYFPALRGPAANYLNALVGFHGILVDHFRPEVNAPAGAQAVAHGQEDFLKAAKSMQNARQSLENTIENHAPTYVGL